MNTRPATFVALLALSIAGCRGVNAPLQGRGDPYMSPQVTFATPALERTLTYSAPVAQRDDAGNLLHVTLPIRTDQSRTTYVDYRVTFLDRSGATLSQSGWMPKTLEANTPDSISVNSMDNRAADFQIAIRQAR